MNTHTAMIGMSGISGSRHYPLNLHLSFIVKRFRDKLLLLIEAILEYALVIHIFAAVGYVAGKYAGFVYAEHYQPTVSPELIKQLWLAPYHFAFYGAITGAIVGVIVMAILTKSRS